MKVDKVLILRFSYEGSKSVQLCENHRLVTGCSGCSTYSEFLGYSILGNVCGCTLSTRLLEHVISFSYLINILHSFVVHTCFGITFSLAWYSIFI